jgi:D-arginine dehydrogenase
MALGDRRGRELVFKPYAGKILASRADETPVEASDAQPEELDIALIADTIERITTMRVGRISHSRAGLPTFAPDQTPVVGFASNTEGFFWLAGQGGYGVETSPAIGVAVANLIVDGNLPLEFLEAGVSEADLTPRRFT